MNCITCVEEALGNSGVSTKCDDVYATSRRRHGVLRPWVPTPAPRYPSAAAASRTTVFAQKLTPTIYQHITPTTRWRCVGNYACVSPKRHDRILPNFLRMSPAAVARFSSGGVAIRYVLPVQCSVIFPAVGAMAQATEVAYSSTRCARRQHGFHMAAYSQTNSPWRSTKPSATESGVGYKLSHTTTPNTTKLSCLCRVASASAVWIAFPTTQDCRRQKI